MNWKYTEDTSITIDGKTHTIRMYPGMTGIGSRKYWIDDNEMRENCVTQSADITKGNHFVYRMKWRDTPWDWIHVIIHEDELPVLLSEDNKWREPKKIEV